MTMFVKQTIYGGETFRSLRNQPTWIIFLLMHKSDFTHLLRITLQLLAELAAISPFGINQLTLLHKSWTRNPATTIKFSAILHLLLSGLYLL